MALRHSARTFSGESLPSSVVRSSIDRANRRAAAFDAVLIDRLVNDAARSLAMTGSTLRVRIPPSYPPGCLTTGGTPALRQRSGVNLGRVCRFLRLCGGTGLFLGHLDGVSERQPRCGVVYPREGDQMGVERTPGEKEKE